MANLKRKIPLQFYVNEEEKKMIRKKMIMSKTGNMSAYLRKMAIDGIIANIDTTYQKQIYQEMHKIGVNANQLAKVANITGAATPEDMAEMKGLLNKIWHILKSSRLNPL